jgi:hypothetical protein
MEIYGNLIMKAGGIIAGEQVFDYGGEKRKREADR